MNSKRPTWRHIIIKKDKYKKGILNAAREKWFITYKGFSIRLWANFSLEALETWRWDEITTKRKKLLKEKKNCQPRIL